MNETNPLLLKGLNSFHQGELHEARRLFEAALVLEPHGWQILLNLGVTLARLNLLEKARSTLDRCLNLNPESAEALYNRGNVFWNSGDLHGALADYEAALAIRFNHSATHNNRGLVLQELGSLEAAEQSFLQALAIDPENPRYVQNLARLFQILGKHREALNFFEHLLVKTPDNPDIYLDSAGSLIALGNYNDADTRLNKALALDPDSKPRFYFARGVILQKSDFLELAIPNYEKAIEFKFDFPEAHANLGIALCESGFYSRGIQHLSSALDLNPNLLSAHGPLINFKNRICDWDGRAEALSRVEKIIQDQNQAISPFILSTIEVDPKMILKSAQLHWKTLGLSIEKSYPIQQKLIKKKIHLGFFSSDLHQHPTGQLIAELIEELDRTKFNVIGFSYGPAKKDDMKMRLEKAFDEFFEVKSFSSQEIAEKARELGIDIAIDLNGFTKNNRLDIFAQRAAPLQVGYLGYPGTTGAPWMDYLIADKVIIPTEYRDYYSEKIIYMPDTYQPNDSNRKVSERNFTRSELGLPENDFIFCCFNNNYKISPMMFDIWMNILKSVESSVLWLLKSDELSRENLQREASLKSIDPNRLIFAERLKPEEHLARQAHADLFLDTYPYGAHTTASEALWMELPIVTLVGQSFSSRVAASLLTAIGVPELITKSVSEYSQLAISLANDKQLFSQFKERIRIGKMESKLFNSKRYTEAFEEAMVLIHRRSRDLKPPTDIDLKDKT